MRGWNWPQRVFAVELVAEEGGSDPQRVREVQLLIAGELRATLLRAGEAKQAVRAVLSGPDGCSGSEAA